MEENTKLVEKVGSDWGGTHLALDLITPDSLVISCGLANDITFDTYLIENKNCKIIGVDPTVEAYKTVEQFLKANKRYKHKFELLRKAVHAKTGLQVNLGGPAKTFLSPDGEIATTISLEDLILSYPGTSLLKLDIEGAEFLALESLRFRLRIPQLAISFHTWFNSKSDQYPNLGVPEALYTSEDVIEICEKIKTMGYKLVYEWHEDDFRLGQETLFIRKDIASPWDDITLHKLKQE
jgi:FkbM family methyltransferase